MPIIAWFMGTKLGRGLALAFAVLAALATAYVRGRATGKSIEQIKQDREALRVRRDREKTDEAVEARPADARRRDLGKWVSDGGDQ